MHLNLRFFVMRAIVELGYIHYILLPYTQLRDNLDYTLAATSFVIILVYIRECYLPCIYIYTKIRAVLYIPLILIHKFAQF